MKNKAHKIHLRPTQKQEVLFRKACGVQRFAYNWALNRWKELYDEDKKNNIKPKNYQNIIQKELDATKRDKWPWMMETSKGVPQGGIQNLNKAFTNFFKKQCDFPKFKKKWCRDSFRADGNKTPELSIKFSNKYIKFPRIGWVRGSEKLKFDGKMQRVTIVREANDWFAVFVVDDVVDRTIVRENPATVGIDLGLTSFATLSSGEKFEAPKPLKKLEKKLARNQRILSRRVNGSNRKYKARMRVAKIHQRIKNVRHDFLHRLSINLVRKYSVIGIEDLNVKGMVKNRRLSKAISDVGWGEFRRQLEYKAGWYGSQIIKVNRFYPSSKTCSKCEHVIERLELKQREWKCPSCDEEHDRDINVAKNLANMALRAICPEVTHEETEATDFDSNVTTKPGRGIVKFPSLEGV